MAVKVGDRVRLEGESTYLFGFTGTVQGFGVGAAIVQLDEATGVGLPEGFPPGRPVMVKTDSLVVIEPHTLTFHSTITGEEGPVTMTVRY